MLLKLSPGDRAFRIRRSSRAKVKLLLVFAFCLGIAGWLGYRQIERYLTQPDAVLVLGGDPQREVFAADFARSHPDLPIWVSGGTNPEYARWAFARAGIDPNRVYLDYRAVDTVTNFTTLANELRDRGIDSVYLITSDNHMRRAFVIGEIVFGSRGIAFKPVSVPSGQEPEPIQKAVRDGARAILWVVTGRTGSSFGRVFKARY